MTESPSKVEPSKVETSIPSELFEPLRIGNITVRNRVFSSAHGTGFATNGLINDRLIAYHLERARGGIGLIVLEATSIDYSSLGVSRGKSSLRNASDDVLEPYSRLSRALHAEGTKVFCLLSHAGMSTVMGADGEPPLAPSPIPWDRGHDIPHQLDKPEIDEITRNFAAASRRCKLGGLDGVELSYTHGNLVQQFMSPRYNKRTDEYGGSEENRLRMAREVLEACRAAVGPDFVLGLRVTADELVPGGYTIEDFVQWLPRLVEWGALDYIDVSAGTNASMWSRSRHYPTISMPAQPLVEYSRRIKELVNIPVFCVGKITDPVEAGEIVATGKADMVAMTRAHVAEPAIVNLARAGRLDEIRTCIYCNESCFGRQQRVGDITCVYNPRSGRESVWPELARSERPRRITIVGAGPAGLEAARSAALCGHTVTLFEAQPEIGGQLRYIPRTPTRQPYGKILDWYQREITGLVHDIRLGRAATSADVLATNPDVVLIATGSEDTMPDIPISGSPVLTARQVLDGASVKGSVLLGDWDARHMGMSVAELLAGKGHQVELVTNAFFVGIDVDLLTWHPAYERLLNLGVRLSPLEEIVSVSGGRAEIAALNGKCRQVEADTIVLCCRGTARDGLYHELDGKVPMVTRIGDSLAPRQLEQAFYEGAKAIRDIEAAGAR